MEYSLLAAFGIGLFSSAHCIGMCGGIIGALSFGLPPETRDSRWRLLSYILLYNLGRIAGYMLAGALLAGIGSGLLQSVSPQYGHLILQWVAALVMVAIGLYLAGWFPRLALIESIGRPLWRRLEPVGQRLLPVRSPMQALLFGLVWGWLPCGLVYGALIYSLSAGSVAEGALFMGLFGLGTLPAMATAGLLAGRVTHFAQMPAARRLAGISVIALGLIGPAMSIVGGQADHEQHLMGGVDGESRHEQPRVTPSQSRGKHLFDSHGAGH